MDPKYSDIGSPKIKLIEEIGEVLQAISKCDRFGFDSYHPDDPEKYKNKDQLKDELNDLELRLKEYKEYLDTC